METQLHFALKNQRVLMMKKYPAVVSKLLLATLMCCVCSPVYGASSLDGTELAIYWALPFIGILLSLALLPLFAPNFWHRNYGVVSFFWGALACTMIVVSYGFTALGMELIVTYLDHFIPFIIFILSLYVISSGIFLNLQTVATPVTNTIFITIGGLLASWIGTTGAAMLFIQPFLVINKHRLRKTHLLVFYIFIVCNIGGCLSAIGDPPLFLGFLNGVDFFWPTTHLFPAFITVFIPLIFMFFLCDTYYYRKDKKAKIPELLTPSRSISLGVEGRYNIVLLLLAVLSIILSGVFKDLGSVHFFATDLKYANLARDAFLLGLTFCSLKITRAEIRKKNNFSWFPFLEVFKVFAGIFVTASPVLAILKAGENGSLSWLVSTVNTASGPNNELYFWITGILSSLLDNAPTYLVFFNIAGGNAEVLMTTLERTLIAISLGSVFMGAMTYIGNAPNFMVKAIAEQNRIRMPSFFGYIVWSTLILLPLFYISEILWIK